MIDRWRRIPEEKADEDKAKVDREEDYEAAVLVLYGAVFCASGYSIPAPEPSESRFTSTALEVGVSC